MTRLATTRFRGWLGSIPLLLLLAGCDNIWEWSADDDSFDALMSDGREALRSEHYAVAEEKFTAAVEMRPDNSDARYYLAKAAVLNADVDALNNLYATLQNDVAAYYLNNGIPGNPGEGDNDGDGVADEECFNGVDDDGDGRTDEDARVAGC